MNLLNSCVPFGRRLNIYSAPTIAVNQDLGFLFIVDKNRKPSGFRRLIHVLTSSLGSGTCSSTSRQVTISKDSESKGRFVLSPKI